MFVHGQSCDTRHWREQVPYFSKNPRVITIDLAGHGHSMGSSVIAETACLMPGKVLGLIGVDTLQDIEYKMTQNELDKMLAPIKKDFSTGSRQFVIEMIRPSIDPKLKEWILSDMS